MINNNSDKKVEWVTIKSEVEPIDTFAGLIKNINYRLEQLEEKFNNKEIDEQIRKDIEHVKKSLGQDRNITAQGVTISGDTIVTGKLAMLHENEVVLNAEDAKELLKMVDIVNKYIKR